MTSYPVLDDNTRDAMIIGSAASPAEAVGVWRAVDGNDEAPQPLMFCYRHPSDLAKNVAVDCPDGAYEPVWAR